MHPAQERLHRQSTAVAGAATSRKDVVGPGEVVAQADRRVRTDEDRPRVADALTDRCGIGHLDLEVLGGVGVDDGQPGVEVVDQDHSRLGPGERLPDAFGVLGGRHPVLEVGLDRIRQRDGVGHQDRGGLGVVLGLRDEVGADVRGLCRVVGEDRDLGRAGLGVDADDALEVALGGRDVDVARPRDEADRLTDDGGALVRVGLVLETEGEGSDRLGSTHGIHLVHASSAHAARTVGWR